MLVALHADSIGKSFPPPTPVPSSPRPSPTPRPPCADSLAPLINLALRRKDAVGVFSLSVALWEAVNAVQARHSLHQLQYLSAIVDTSRAKALQSGSDVMRRRFAAKVKIATVRVRHVCACVAVCMCACMCVGGRGRGLGRGLAPCSRHAFDCVESVCATATLPYRAPRMRSDASC